MNLINKYESDYEAVNFLESQGYKEVNGMIIGLDRPETEAERAAINYLFQEWDYGFEPFKKTNYFMNNTNLTAPQIIKKAIFTHVFTSGDFEEDFPIKQLPIIPEAIETAFSLMKKGYYGQDLCNEWRELGVDTKLPAPYCRHYEIDILAREIDGFWVMWNFEHGGGKFADFSAFDWIETAEFVDCKEEERMVTVRTFTKK